MEINAKDYIVYDAKGRVLGRVASAAAKAALRGKKIAIINAGDAIISGNKKDIIKKYNTRLRLQEKANPEHSPYWSRRPDMLMKRVIRGMLPYRKASGKSAYRRLLVFTGTPEIFKEAKIEDIRFKGKDGMYVKSIKLSELSRLLGYRTKA
ncbi:MAG: 50S ribosomal protein L13 [Candidatus Micrarchaeaceae archaeon]